MRVAVISDTYPPFINGVSSSTFNLVKTLKEHGEEVLVVTLRSDKGKLEVKDGVVYIPGLELKNLYSYRQPLHIPRKVYKIIKSFKPQVIHCQTDGIVGQYGRIVSRRLNVPFIYTYHTSMEDYTSYVPIPFLDRLFKRVVRGYAKIRGNNSSAFITPSLKTKEYMRYASSDIYIDVVPTGIDFSKFSIEKIDSAKMEEFKKEHNIKKDTKVFLLLGRLAKEKSMDVSLKCLNSYHLAHPEQDIKVFIVGGGPSEEELKNIADELNMNSYVTFLGPKDTTETPFYYHLADIYTSASITETQGLTFMEAMASNTLVLARFDDNLSGTIQDGINGYFFTDEKSFVRKCEEIFTMSEKELKELKTNAFNSLSIYSMDTFYKNIMEVYTRAVKKFW